MGRVVSSLVGAQKWEWIVGIFGRFKNRNKHVIEDCAPVSVDFGSVPSSTVSVIMVPGHKVF